MTLAGARATASYRRTRLQHLVLGLVSSLGAFALSAGGCTTGAVGVEACRDIEHARCEAAASCGRIDDVAACQRFYRDHCLHGLADGVEQPTDDQVKACVSTIEKAGKCAKDDPTVLLTECDPPVTSDSHGARLACTIVLLPEWSAECAFLGKRGDFPERDGGQGGTSSGAGGQGGAP